MYLWDFCMVEVVGFVFCFKIPRISRQGVKGHQFLIQRLQESYTGGSTERPRPEKRQRQRERKKDGG